MALAGGRLILRDAKTMKCLEVATNEETPNRWVEVGAFDTGLTRVRGVAVAQDDGKEEILVAGDREIRVFDAAGLTIRRHKLAAEPFAVAAVDSGEMWVAFDRHVEAFDSAGRLTAACDPRGQRSALAGLTVSDDFIYVGDAGLRLIHRYDREMRYQDSFPEEPDDEARLAVPSRYLDAVAAPGELVFVLNPGRHRVAAYSHGRKAFHWGTPGRSEDEFPGCCNPIALAVLPGGDLVTGEKGQVLVKRFTPEGVFVDDVRAYNRDSFGWAEAWFSVWVVVNRSKEIPNRSQVSRNWAW